MAYTDIKKETVLCKITSSFGKYLYRGIQIKGFELFHINIPINLQ
jgi:hypothetical protein